MAVVVAPEREVGCTVAADKPHVQLQRWLVGSVADDVVGFVDVVVVADGVADAEAAAVVAP